MAFSLRRGNKIKREEFIMLCTTMSWMLTAGISVRDGVDKLIEDKNNKMNPKILNLTTVKFCLRS